MTWPLPWWRRRSPEVVSPPLGSVEQEIEQRLGQLGGRMTTSRWTHEAEGDWTAQDYEWNFLDHLHRPIVHHTYSEAIRLVLTPDVAVSVTTMRRAGTRWLIQVAGMRLRPGVYLQSFTVFSIFHVSILMRILPTSLPARLVTTCWVTSARPWRILHGVIHRSFRRLCLRQDAEDLPLRWRRTELRRKGFSFGGDQPYDFVSANDLGSHTEPPPLSDPQRMFVGDAAVDGLQVRAVGDGRIAFVVRRNSDRSLSVWPEACPHEGASLGTATACGDDLRCPWHGLPQRGVRLSADTPVAQLEMYRLTLDGDEITIEDVRPRGA